MLLINRKSTIDDMFLGVNLNFHAICEVTCLRFGVLPNHDLVQDTDIILIFQASPGQRYDLNSTTADWRLQSLVCGDDY